MDKAGLQEIFDSEFPRYVEEWKELLRFPSISAEPAHDPDCNACAEWLAAHLHGMGVDGGLLETSGNPVVYGEHPGDPNAPAVLFYAHYDVQPADPLEDWHSPPFEPEIRNGRMFGRGAEDNKGQLLYVLKAIEALRSRGGIKGPIKVMLDGEEECGDAATMRKLRDWRDLLAADVLMVCDTGMVNTGAPTIVMGLRGIIFLTVELSGPSMDLHSGVHGGVAPNPATAMAALVASLHNPDGSIAVPRYYDGVAAPSAEERDLARAVPFDPEQYRSETGVAPVGGESRFTPVERRGFRPSIGVNGIQSGYSGNGIKTIIPSTAKAKITSRLVAGQDPQACLEGLISHLEHHAPAGLQLEITEAGVGGPGLRLDPGSTLVAKARHVLDGLTDQPTAFLWEGASIPLVAALAEASGAEPLLVGFGAAEDNVHAPNESFSLENFKLGYLYAGSMLSALQTG